MADTADDRRIANDKANKEAMAEQLSESDNASDQREAERQAEEARGLGREQDHRNGAELGSERTPPE